jgi:hypothetical protein
MGKTKRFRMNYKNLMEWRKARRKGRTPQLTENNEEDDDDRSLYHQLRRTVGMATGSRLFHLNRIAERKSVPPPPRLLPLLAWEMPGSPDDPTYVAALMNGTLTQEEYNFVHKQYNFDWISLDRRSLAECISLLESYANNHPNVAGVIGNLVHGLINYILISQ